MMIETERLLLREYTMDDFDALYEIMSDAETMQHYPAPFDEARTRRWIEWNLENYARYGFGLWALVLKETGEFIGDCGITIQNIDGEKLPEIGYHIHKKCWRQGFAKEAAKAVRDWAFENTDYTSLYSYCKYTNKASYKTAEAIGMHFDKEYPDDANRITHVSVIHRAETGRKPAIAANNTEQMPLHGYTDGKNMIRIELLSETNFCLGSLDLYNRKQDVNKVFRRIDGEYVLVECRYTEDWDLNKKRSVAEKICSDAYITYIALENDKVVGFIGLLRKLSGPYMVLDMMQVSSECRGQGIGRRLFEAGKEEARKSGAQALYISACSSEETIAFYRAMGSELASNPIKEIAEEEPFDLQMICPVND